MRRSDCLRLSLMAFVLSCGSLAGFAQSSKSASKNEEVSQSLKKFAEVYSVGEQNYAQPVSGDKTIYNGALPGMLRVLDPHSTFFAPRQYGLLREQQQGRYYG